MTSVGYRRSILALRFSRAGLLLFAASLTASCASQYVNQLAQVSANSNSFHISTELGSDACRSALSQPAVSEDNELDASNIRLVNWNVHKQTGQNWKHDYDKLASGTDLVLIQEASLRTESINDIDATMHWSFAPGYRTSGEITGVLTLSRIKPLVQCSFVNLEPVLRTPKATSITQYGLSGTDETLVVVNVHAVNITLGMGAYRNQFKQIEETLSQHSGPIILSGDFNTWRARRAELVEELVSRLGLTELQFADDNRVRFLGQALDHIYVRGLSAVKTNTSQVETSDHNPMSVTFSL